jgi:PAS domain S-box-containing protein
VRFLGPWRISGVVLLYIAVAGGWIAASDSILSGITADLSLLTRLQTLKGWFFVALTAVLLYFLLWRENRGHVLRDRALRQSEEKYRRLFEGLADGALLMTNRVIECNDAMCRLWAATRDDIIGKSPLDFSPPVQPDGCSSAEAAAAYMQAARGGAPQLFEWRHRRADSTLFDAEVSVRLVTIGEQSLLQAMVRDITSRKEADALLRESETRFRELADLLPQTVFEIDPLGNLTFCNRNALDMFRYTQAEFDAGVNVLDTLIVEDRERARLNITRALQGDTRTNDTYTALRRDGTTFPVTIYATRILHGEAVVGLRGLVVDMSEWEQITQAVADHARQLEAVRAVSSEITQELDLPTVLPLITQRACQLTGAVAGDLYLWDGDAGLLRPTTATGRAVTYPKMPRRLGEGLLGIVARDRAGMIVNDYRHCPDAHPETLANSQITAALVEPLLYGDRILGVLALSHVTPDHTFTGHDQATLRLFAAQAAITIENGRLYQAAVAHSEQREALLRATRAIMTGLTLHDTLEHIISEAARIAKCDHIKLLLVDRDTQMLHIAVARGLFPQAGFPMPVGTGLSGIVARTGQSLYIADTQTDSRSVLADHDRAVGLRTYLGLPITVGPDVVGVLTFNTTDPRDYTDTELQLLTSFADHAAIAIANARLYEDAQRELRQRQEAESQLRTIARAVEQASSAVIITDAQGSIQFVNPKFTEVTGYTAAEALGQNPRILKSEAMSAQTYQDLWTTLTGGQTWRGEFLNRKKNGEFYWEDASISPVRDPDGRVTHYVAVKDDITERKRTEQALQTRTAQLEAIRTVSTEITQELDLTSLFTLIIQRAIGLLDTTQGCLYLWDAEHGLLVPQVWPGHGDWVRDVRLKLGEAVAGTVAQRRVGIIVNDFSTSPYALPHILPHATYSGILAEPLLYRDRLLGVITINDDKPDRRFTEAEQSLLRLFANQAAVAIENARLYTEVNQSFQDLQRAQEELVRAEKLRAIGQLSAGIAHDLNNVLAAILGQAELLRLKHDGSTPPPELDTIVTAASDGAHIVRRLQDFSRQQPSQKLSPIELSAVVVEALQITRPRWRDESERLGRPITIETSVTNLPPILGSAAEIREALTNLILNAVDAMPNGGRIIIHGETVPTDVDASRPHAVDLSITDTGTGMAEDVRRRLFEPFFTTKGMKGTGLGLSMVYGIMTRHGGRIDVASAPGQGTTFRLRFQPAAADTSAAEASVSQRTSAPLSILFVDDDPSVRVSLVELLRAMGHTVFEADSAKAGLARLASTTIDLILTDLGMPETNGLEFARAVRATHPTTPILLCSGWNDLADDRDVASGLITDVLQKPISLRQLQEAVERHRPLKGDTLRP